MIKFVKLLPFLAVFMLSTNFLAAEETEKPEITEEISLSAADEEIDAPVTAEETIEETVISEE